MSNLHLQQLFSFTFPAASNSKILFVESLVFQVKMNGILGEFLEIRWVEIIINTTCQLTHPGEIL
ncbi:hypothetical protein M5D96_012168 [Drosophila gunungcola]|uniref:Uncharacterized protein n=1 Tax=Drosophila gunungcola TaxID=103775 RepID=A0A9Q0BKL1_9MUSC|nr:hypothetical protein M5D96_012168 [Drosophila gunungcola]